MYYWLKGNMADSKKSVHLSKIPAHALIMGLHAKIKKEKTTAN